MLHFDALVDSIVDACDLPADEDSVPDGIAGAKWN